MRPKIEYIAVLDTPDGTSIVPFRHVDCCPHQATDQHRLFVQPLYVLKPQRTWRRFFAFSVKEQLRLRCHPHLHCVVITRRGDALTIR
jgi:hypothetical protein